MSFRETLASRIRASRAADAPTPRAADASMAGAEPPKPSPKAQVIKVAAGLVFLGSGAYVVHHYLSDERKRRPRVQRLEDTVRRMNHQMDPFRLRGDPRKEQQEWDAIDADSAAELAEKPPPDLLSYSTPGIMGVAGMIASACVFGAADRGLFG